LKGCGGCGLRGGDWLLLLFVNDGELEAAEDEDDEEEQDEGDELGE
jgi:hypothetical protein